MTISPISRLISSILNMGEFSLCSQRFLTLTECLWPLECRIHHVGRLSTLLNPEKTRTGQTRPCLCFPRLCLHEKTSFCITRPCPGLLCPCSSLELQNVSVLFDFCSVLPHFVKASPIDLKNTRKAIKELKTMINAQFISEIP